MQPTSEYHTSNILFPLMQYFNFTRNVLSRARYQSTSTSRELCSVRVIRVLQLHENFVQCALSEYFNFTRTLFSVRYQSTFNFTRTLLSRRRNQITLTSRELCSVRVIRVLQLHENSAQCSLSEYFNFTRTLFCSERLIRVL